MCNAYSGTDGRIKRQDPSQSKEREGRTPAAVNLCNLMPTNKITWRALTISLFVPTIGARAETLTPLQPPAHARSRTQSLPRHPPPGVYLRSGFVVSRDFCGT